ncbi:CLUMA_CG002846, isoform A [Clunio marinus]|uniref:CLUMA_CG002846, isoform A n=1 Tax=Clunio marinus TaxID=568069 RepID=A0A1J1HL36_9DIPT|nr:CLUMA_CG002846, isoform A [Clunio marinus]
MYMFEIQNFMRNQVKEWKNVYVISSDNFPSKFKTPIGIICNTAWAGEPGIHWQAIFIDDNNNSKFFCSYVNLLRLITNVYRA